MIITKECIHVLLEGTPHGLDSQQLKEGLLGKFNIIDMHHIHLWSLSEDYNIATMHLVIDNLTYQDTQTRSKLLQEIKQYLKRELKVAHATIELEEPGCPCSDSEYD